MNRIKVFFRNLISTIKSLITFEKPIDYKAMYENERRLRIQMEQNHKAFCGQISATLKESKERFTIYKATDNHREF